jgi:hypothetical protein
MMETGPPESNLAAHSVTALASQLSFLSSRPQGTVSESYSLQFNQRSQRWPLPT